MNKNIRENLRGVLGSFLFEEKMNESSSRTIKKYESDIEQFISSLESIRESESLSKQDMLNYKNFLMESFKPNSVNNKITIVNKFVKYMGREDLKLKELKQQQETSLDNVITKEEYYKLLNKAQELKDDRMYALMSTLAQSGIRYSELKFITIESLDTGIIKVSNKSKIRTIVLTDELINILKVYSNRHNIETGIIFRNREGGSIIDQAYLWRKFKYIAKEAGVDTIKVHAHSFRHLFAKLFLAKVNNILLLADVLGHSSLVTTRLYTKYTSSEIKETMKGIF